METDLGGASSGAADGGPEVGQGRVDGHARAPAGLQHGSLGSLGSGSMDPLEAAEARAPQEQSRTHASAYNPGSSYEHPEPEGVAGAPRGQEGYSLEGERVADRPATPPHSALGQTQEGGPRGGGSSLDGRSIQGAIGDNGGSAASGGRSSKRRGRRRRRSSLVYAAEARAALLGADGSDSGSDGATGSIRGKLGSSMGRRGLMTSGAVGRAAAMGGKDVPAWQTEGKLEAEAGEQSQGWEQDADHSWVGEQRSESGGGWGSDGLGLGSGSSAGPAHGSSAGLVPITDEDRAMYGDLRIRGKETRHLREMLRLFSAQLRSQMAERTPVEALRAAAESRARLD